MLGSRKPRRRLGMISAAVAQGMLQAHVLKSKLDAFGVPCVLEYESYGQVLGVTVDGLGAVFLMVPEAFAEQARSLLEPSGTDQWPGVQDDEAAVEWDEGEADTSDSQRRE